MIKYILLLICLIVTVSCTNNIKTRGDSIILSGKIKNPKDKNLIIISSNRDTVEVNSDGTFLDTLNLGTGLHLVTYDKIFFRAYFKQGYPVSMNFDAGNFRNSLQFDGGKVANINRYLLKKQQIEGEFIGNKDFIFGLDETAFKNRINQLKENSKKFLMRNQILDDNFKELEIRNLQYEYLNRLLNYERSHKYLTKNPNFKVTEGFLPRLDTLDYTKIADYEYSLSYKRFVKNHYDKLATDLLRADNIEDITIAQIKTYGGINNDLIKNSLLKQTVVGITYTDHLDDYYNAFINASTDNEQKATIENYYKKLKAVEKGQFSPIFTNYENYAGGTTSLDELKGKYVYIDVWATWCGPCIAEIPSLKKTENAYHDKNIEFVSISIDKPDAYDKWRKMVEDRALGGVQLLADNNWESQFVKDYAISGIPKFILLDPEGKIITANAPRPSDPKLIELFNELNI